MPRQSSRASTSAPQRAAPAPSYGRAAPKPAAAPAAAQQAPPPAAAPAAAPPAVAPSGGGMMSGLMGSMMSGMAAGTGMAVANRAVDAVMGPRQTEVVHRQEGAPAAPAATSQPVCQFQQEQLMQCMKSSSDASACQSYMDALKACQQAQWGDSMSHPRISCWKRAGDLVASSAAWELLSYFREPWVSRKDFMAWKTAQRSQGRKKGSSWQ